MESQETTDNGKGRLRALLRLLGISALAALALVVVVVAVCWAAGWRTAPQISSGLSVAGGVAIAMGVLSVVGGWGLTRDSGYMYAQSVSQQTITERTRQGLGDSLRSYNFHRRHSGRYPLCRGQCPDLGGC